jgi:carbonic anhydrase
MVALGTGASKTATGALEQLGEGNTRFLDAIAATEDPDATTASLAAADPYAIVLGCSDSRVPPEIVFDEPPGRLFVIRVASNVAGNDETGTIEYAVARWGCPLVVVLGHTQCGGVAAVMDPPPPGADPTPNTSGAINLLGLLAAIRGNLGWSAAGCKSADPWFDAVCLNVRRSMEQLRTRSLVIRRQVDAGDLRIVGAVYHVETGAVEFLDAR